MINFYPQSSGNAGNMQAISKMVQIVNKAYYHPVIRDRAASIVGNHATKDQAHWKLISFVRSNMNYVPDPNAIEALHDPVTWIEPRLRAGFKPYGDCDDMSIYLASLLKAVGHAPKFYVISRRPDKLFHHIMVVCEGTVLDATRLVTMMAKPTASLVIPI
mgnify:FL=1